MLAEWLLEAAWRDNPARACGIGALAANTGISGRSGRAAFLALMADEVMGADGPLGTGTPPFAQVATLALDKAVRPR